MALRLLVSLTVLGAVAGAAPAVASAYCSPVEVIDSRGSGGVGFSDPGAAFRAALARRIAFPVAIEANPYPAVSIVGTIDQIKRGTVGLDPGKLVDAIRDSLNGVGANLPRGLHVGRYHESVESGRKELRRLIDDVRDHCGLATQIILTGYSQGAQVAGDVFAGLSPDSRRSIAGVALFGDPRYRRDSYAGQARLDRDGILGARDELPDEGRGKVLSYCHSGDLICQTLGTTGPHGTYASAGDADVAAAVLAPRVDLAHSAAFEIAVRTHDYRVGALHVRFDGRAFSRSATLAGADRAFGDGDACASGRYADVAHAHWARFGLRGEFATLGGFAKPNGQFDRHGTGCKYPGQINLSGLEATGSYWHTSAGLRIGDSLTRLLELYPTSTAHSDGWWLEAKDQEYGPPQVVGSLVAVVRGDRVVGLTVNVGSEGD